MSIIIGYITSESQVNIKELDSTTKEVTSKIVDTIELKDHPFNLLLTPNDNLDALEKTLEQERKFYPVIEASQVNLSKEDYESLDADALTELFTKVNARWILNNNIQTIESVYSLITYLKDLYVSDRDNFFEELWFLLKTNLASSELNIVFHDLKEPTEKQKEKGEKPKLTYSFITGKKLPNIQPATEREEMLMKEYQNEFGEVFNITEFDSNKGHLVATAKIELSPILIMAKLNSFNQLQQSILIALFSGLQPQQ
jgi:hypothetical protein